MNIFFQIIITLGQVNAKKCYIYKKTKSWEEKDLFIFVDGHFAVADWLGCQNKQRSTTYNISFKYN